MGQIGIWQIAVVLLLVFFLFGAKKIPDIARSLGKAKGEFKKGIEEGKKAAAEAADEPEEKQA